MRGGYNLEPRSPTAKRKGHLKFFRQTERDLGTRLRLLLEYRLNSNIVRDANGEKKREEPSSARNAWQ